MCNIRGLRCRVQQGRHGCCCNMGQNISEWAGHEQSAARHAAQAVPMRRPPSRRLAGALARPCSPYPSPASICLPEAPSVGSRSPARRCAAAAGVPWAWHLCMLQGSHRRAGCGRSSPTQSLPRVQPHPPVLRAPGPAGALPGQRAEPPGPSGRLPHSRCSGGACRRRCRARSAAASLTLNERSIATADCASPDTSLQA